MNKGRKFDLTGQRFGRMTVLKFAETRNRKNYWLCRCDCGNEKQVIDYALKSGDTQSCGCMGREHRKAAIVAKAQTAISIGVRFGKLIIIGYDESHKGRGIYCRCHCDCGNEIIVSLHALRRGNTSSCGCGEAENKRKIYSHSEPYHIDGTNVSFIREKKPRSNNKSGHRGVYFLESRNQWIAKITLAGKNKVKYFSKDKLEDAIKWRQQMEERMFTPVIDKWKEEHGGQNSSGID
jgi:hypothetical protein